MFGFHNMVVRINATQRSFDLKIISDDLLRRTLGGKGLAMQLLLSHNSPNVDALDPENHLVLATGPTSRTGLWGACRHGIFTKYPQAGYFAESYSSGTVADYIAGTGFDAVIIRGASKDPVWLEVCEETIGFHAAGDLWGLDSCETEDRIKLWIKGHRAAAKDCGIVAIGPEAESPVSDVENDDWGSDGGSGTGAVMGSKKIKAVAFWGDRKKEFADPELIRRLTKDIARRAKENAGGMPNKSMGSSCDASGLKANHACPASCGPVLSEMIDPGRILAAAKAFVEWEDRMTILDSLILCRPQLDLYQWEELAATIKGVTGLDLTKEGMRSIARSIADHTRRFNLREGWKPEKDRFSRLVFTETVSETRRNLSERDERRLLADYYKERGWDRKGRPPKQIGA